MCYVNEPIVNKSNDSDSTINNSINNKPSGNISISKMVTSFTKKEQCSNDGDQPLFVRCDRSDSTESDSGSKKFIQCIAVVGFIVAIGKVSIILYEMEMMGDHEMEMMGDLCFIIFLLLLPETMIAILCAVIVFIFSFLMLVDYFSPVKKLT